MVVIGREKGVDVECSSYYCYVTVRHEFSNYNNNHAIIPVGQESGEGSARVGFVVVGRRCR